MTMPDPEDDSALAARIRAAAQVAFDDIAVTEAVLARVHAKRRAAPAPQRRTWLVWFGPAAFASILAATPFVVASYPVADEDFLMALALGDARAILGQAAIGGGLE
ncbi:MAG: hypothetical protein MUE52_06150 [Tabrizicola sp.]|jgi:hypothetical protein|nr:hypothetical protein [Tabrizicola sp.]